MHCCIGNINLDIFGIAKEPDHAVFRRKCATDIEFAISLIIAETPVTAREDCSTGTFHSHTAVFVKVNITGCGIFATGNDHFFRVRSEIVFDSTDISKRIVADDLAVGEDIADSVVVRPVSVHIQHFLRLIGQIQVFVEDDQLAGNGRVGSEGRRSFDKVVIGCITLADIVDHLVGTDCITRSADHKAARVGDRAAVLDRGVIIHHKRTAVDKIAHLELLSIFNRDSTHILQRTTDVEGRAVFHSKFGFLDTFFGVRAVDIKIAAVQMAVTGVFTGNSHDRTIGIISGCCMTDQRIVAAAVLVNDKRTIDRQIFIEGEKTEVLDREGRTFLNHTGSGLEHNRDHASRTLCGIHSDFAAGCQRESASITAHHKHTIHSQTVRSMEDRIFHTDIAAVCGQDGVFGKGQIRIGHTHRTMRNFRSIHINSIAIRRRSLARIFADIQITGTGHRFHIKRGITAHKHSSGTEDVISCNCCKSICSGVCGNIISIDIRHLVNDCVTVAGETRIFRSITDLRCSGIECDVLSFRCGAIRSGDVFCKHDLAVFDELNRHIEFIAVCNRSTFRKIQHENRFTGNLVSCQSRIIHRNGTGIFHILQFCRTAVLQQQCGVAIDLTQCVGCLRKFGIVKFKFRRGICDIDLPVGIIHRIHQEIVNFNLGILRQNSAGIESKIRFGLELHLIVAVADNFDVVLIRSINVAADIGRIIANKHGIGTQFHNCIFVLIQHSGRFQFTIDLVDTVFAEHNTRSFVHLQRNFRIQFIGAIEIQPAIAVSFNRHAIRIMCGDLQIIEITFKHITGHIGIHINRGDSGKCRTDGCGVGEARKRIHTEIFAVSEIGADRFVSPSCVHIQIFAADVGNEDVSIFRNHNVCAASIDGRNLTREGRAFHIQHPLEGIQSEIQIRQIHHDVAATGERFRRDQRFGIQIHRAVVGDRLRRKRGAVHRGCRTFAERQFVLEGERGTTADRERGGSRHAGNFLHRAGRMERQAVEGCGRAAFQNQRTIAFRRTTFGVADISILRSRDSQFCAVLQRDRGSACGVIVVDIEVGSGMVHGCIVDHHIAFCLPVVRNIKLCAIGNLNFRIRTVVKTADRNRVAVADIQGIIIRSAFLTHIHGTDRRCAFKRQSRICRIFLIIAHRNDIDIGVRNGKVSRRNNFTDADIGTGQSSGSRQFCSDPVAILILRAIRQNIDIDRVRSGC